MVSTPKARAGISFDAVWSVETAIRPQGYVVLISVPFSSLRFPRREEHRWGLFVYRGMPRKNEETFWPAYSIRYQNRLAYAAELIGVRGIDPGGRVQLLPYASAAGDDAEDAGSVEGRAGLDVKLAARENLVVDLTANPDFSQVESDEPQTTVNRRFEAFFPERRPFFIENAGYFETPIQVLFTRRIREPRLGARFSGKAGKYAVGALVADDRFDGSTSVTSVARVSRDLRGDSHVGAIYAGVHGETSNRVAGLGGRWRVSPNVVTAVQAVASESREAAVDPVSGSAIRASVDANGRHFVSSSAFSRISTGFRTDAGFVPRTDIRELVHSTRIDLRPAHGPILVWGPTLTATRLWDVVGEPLDGTGRLDLGAELRRQTRPRVFHVVTRERLAGTAAASNVGAPVFAQHATGAGLSSAPLAGLRFDAEYSAGTAVNLRPAEGRSLALANSRNGSVTLGVRPTPSLTVDTTYLWLRLDERDRGARIFTNHLVRSRWNYQVTRRLSARTIVSHDRVAADPARSSLTETRRTNVDLLLTYFVQPGTAVYVGVNHDRIGLGEPLSRRVFLKVSYLIRS